MNIVEYKNVLLDVCELNNDPKPIYKIVQKYDKNDQGHLHRKFYECHVQIGKYTFSSQSLSKRMAKNFAANEATKHLRFKKCRGSAVTKLVRFCDDHSLKAPIFTEKIEDNIYSVVSEVNLQTNEQSFSLDGKGCSDSPKMAKIAAAKDLLGQLVTILNYATYEPPNMEKR